MASNVLELRGISNFLGGRWVHEDLDLDVRRGELIAIIGASGCGKTTLLRTILMLQKPERGDLRLFGVDMLEATPKQLALIRQRWGVMFQTGALFSSLSVIENIIFPLKVMKKLSAEMMSDLARVKIALVGLEQSVAEQYPAELSGGMIKRVAIARALALDPELVFLDEPTAGLDPRSASELDELVLNLRNSLGLTGMMITHDLDTLWRVPDRVVFLGEGQVLAAEPMQELVKNKHPLIQDYFSSARAKQRMVSE